MSCQWGLGEVLTQRPGKLGECSCCGSSLLLLAHWLILLFPCTLAFPDSLPGERLTLRLNLTCSYTFSSLKKEVYWFLPSLSQFQTYRKRDPGWPSFGLDDFPWSNQLWLGARAHDTRWMPVKEAAGVFLELENAQESSPWVRSEKEKSIPVTESWTPLDYRCWL